MSGAGQGSTRICGSVVSRNAMEMSGLRKLGRCNVRNLQTTPRARLFLLWAAAALAREARLAYRAAQSRGPLAPLAGTALSRGHLAPLGQSRLPSARKSGSIELRLYHGGVAERLNAAVLKTVGRLVRLESSNLSSSAIRRRSALASTARELFFLSVSSGRPVQQDACKPADTGQAAKYDSATQIYYAATITSGWVFSSLVTKGDLLGKRSPT